MAGIADDALGAAAAGAAGEGPGEGEGGVDVDVEEDALLEAALNTDAVLGNFEAAGPAAAPVASAATVELWRLGAVRGAEALLNRHQACVEMPLGCNGGDECSLVRRLTDNQVLVVAWVNTDTRFGRIAKLDIENRIIAFVNARDRPGAIVCSIIHPAIGRRPRKIGGPSKSRLEDNPGTENLRPVVPDEIIKLKRMWQLAWSS